MSEENTTPETTDTPESGENTESNVQETKEELVPKAQLQKVLDDMHKFKKMAKEYEGQVKEREMSELKQREEWQKVAEIKEKEAMEAKEEASKLKNSFVNMQKFSALKQAAVANGIRKEALSDLELYDFDEHVAIETTNTGKMNVLGVETAIKQLKADKPHWFGKSMGSVNTDSPDVVSGGEITMDKLIEAQQKANKSGDYAEYSKVLKAYQAQQRG